MRRWSGEEKNVLFWEGAIISSACCDVDISSASLLKCLLSWPPFIFIDGLERIAVLHGLSTSSGSHHLVTTRDLLLNGIVFIKRLQQYLQDKVMSYDAFSWPMISTIKLITLLKSKIHSIVVLWDIVVHRGVGVDNDKGGRLEVSSRIAIIYPRFLSCSRLPWSSYEWLKYSNFHLNGYKWSQTTCVWLIFV